MNHRTQTTVFPIMRVQIDQEAMEPTRRYDILPSYKSVRAAGLDLHYAGRESMYLAVGSRRVLPTGVRVELPPGTMGEVRPRSGWSKLGIDSVVGTIDEDYRGEIGVLLVNNSDNGISIQPGERIAQLVVVPYVRVAVDVLAPGDRLSETDRGAKGWGSTGT